MQAVKEHFGQICHLLRVQPGDGLVLKVIIDGIIKMVRRGRIVPKSLMRRADKAEKPGNVFSLEPGLFLGGGVGVKVGAKRDAKTGAFISVAPPLLIVLRIIALAVPLTAVAAAENGKVNTGGLGFFPVHLTLIFAHINAFFGGSQNWLAHIIKIIARFILLPCACRCAGVNHRRALGASIAGHTKYDHKQHSEQDCRAEKQTKALLPAAFCRPRFLPGRGIAARSLAGGAGLGGRALIAAFLLFHSFFLTSCFGIKARTARFSAVQ